MTTHKLLGKCPKCQQDITLALLRYFRRDPVGTGFDFKCPNCATSLEVEVEVEPRFWVSRPTQDAPDVAYCAECEWKLGSDGECINGCVQPIATQVI